MSGIFSRCYVLEIFFAVIAFVSIDMIYLRFIFGVWYEGFGNQPMDEYVLRLTADL